MIILAFADTPARRSWAMTCGHSGRSGCDKCFIRGDVREGQRHVTFGGYVDAAPAALFSDDGQWSEGTVCYADGDGGFDVQAAERLLITHEKHRMRCELADAESASLAKLYPLPDGAADGGDLLADPSSPEQRALTEGASKPPCLGPWSVSQAVAQPALAADRRH